MRITRAWLGFLPLLIVLIAALFLSPELLVRTPVETCSAEDLASSRGALQGTVQPPGTAVSPGEDELGPQLPTEGVNRRTSIPDSARQHDSVSFSGPNARRSYKNNPFFRVRILESDETGSTLEIRIHQFEHSETAFEGRTFDILSLPGAAAVSEPGLPRLPMIGVLYGVPPDGEPAVKVLDTEYQYLDGYYVPPVETRTPNKSGEEGAEAQVFYIEDKRIYQSAEPYPARLAETGFSAVVRGLNVRQLRIFPFQYNPVDKRVTFHKKMILRIDVIRSRESEFPKRMRSPRSRERRLREMPVRRLRSEYEEIFRNTVVNFSEAREWIQGGYATPGSFEDPARIFPASSVGSYKIEVDSAGVYRLDHAYLTSIGFPVDAVDPQNLQIHCRGEQIPILVSGEDDGSLDEPDYIEFYGIPAGTMFTDTNIYWLLEGTEPGQRIQEVEAAWTGAITEQETFRDRLHAEENILYWITLPNGEGLDHWFWRIFQTSSVARFDLPLSNLADVENQCTLRVRLQGRTDAPSPPPLDHRAILMINDQMVGDARWDGQIPHEYETTFSQSYLNDGDNEVGIIRGSTGAIVDQFYLDWFELEYWRTFKSEDGVLRFWAGGEETQGFAVTGYGTPNIHLYDVTVPHSPVELVDFEIEEEGGRYTLRFESDISGTKEFLAVEDSSLLEPRAVVLDRPSDYRSPVNGADCMAIAHGDLIESLAPLADAWGSKGLRTQIVNIEDVYDEFSFGIFDPTAIRDFLRYAYLEWARPAPLYVLLAGDASRDYKDHRGHGDFPHVPTHMQESVTEGYPGEYGTDNWFVCVDGEDDLPEMLVGRITARGEQDILAFVSKVLSYESVRESNEWNADVALVADDELRFEITNDYFERQLPAGYDPLKVYLRYFESVDAARARLIEILSSGCLILLYTGHGEFSRWSNSALFLSSHVDLLGETRKLPLVIAMSCRNGYFMDHSNPYSLAEEFVRADSKGAIAFWSSSWFTYTEDSEFVGSILLDKTFRNDIRILGQSTTYAKIQRAANAYSPSQLSDMVNSMALLGDPTTELALPQPLPPKGLVAQGTGAAINLTWEPNSESDIAGYNVYRQDAPDAGFEKINATLVAAASYRDENVLSDSTYVYYVTAVDNADFESNPSQTLTATTTTYTSDGIPPAVSLEVDQSVFPQGGCVASRPTVSATFADTNGIDCHSLRLLIDEEEIPLSKAEVSCPTGEELVVAGSLTYESDLVEGTHTAKVQVSELSGLEAESELEFQVCPDLQIQWVAVYPNPLVDDAQFSYELTGPAEVKINIYTVAGRLVRSISTALTESPVGTVGWDGRDKEGERLANGIYLYSITANNGHRSTRRLGKLAVVR